MMMPEYRLERAGLEDLEQIALLFDEYRVYYGQVSDLQGVQFFLKARLEADESAIWMAVTGNGANKEAGGFAQLYPSFSSVSMQRLWILNDLYVAAELRGQGLGSLLLDGAREFALSTGSKGLTLTTMTDNTTAQRLYVAKGYVRDDEFYTYNLFLNTKQE
ncbi:GNAT family N-acetyltransferase [Paenibacillus sp. FSL L8-0436]|uniref:GNAT family N-acetyltransferase n=1 Tax=unclassified Paenibacillus TaxID=185978 RepID=UPI000B338D43|nr:GNAT family N-acetyltransferase [Paenibacillus sp. FSL H7-0357]